MIVLVGNAALDDDHTKFIDNSNFVIRFNIPLTYGHKSGTRFDAWVIANSGGGRHFAENRIFLNAPYKNQPSQLWFPRDTRIHRELRKQHPYTTLLKPSAESDYSREIVRLNDLHQEHHVRFSPIFYRECLEVLDTVSRKNDPVRIPSSGFMATYYTLQRYNGAPVTLVGFTFEGWEGHPWHLERQVMRKWVNEEKITIM